MLFLSDLAEHVVMEPLLPTVITVTFTRLLVAVASSLQHRLLIGGSTVTRIIVQREYVLLQMLRQQQCETSR